MAVITWCALGDKPSVVCGALAAIIGPVVEIVLVKVGVFAYNADSDGLFGVGPWLVPLYFAFGVVELAWAAGDSGDALRRLMC